MTAFDRGLTRAVQAADWPGWIDAFFVWLTAPPFKLLWLGGLVLVVVLAGGRRGRVAALLAVVAVAIADQVAAELVKPWVDRLRPCFALPEVRLLLPRQAHSPSFPSNHAANAFAAAVALFAWRREAGWLGLGLAALVAWSRVHVGVHFPTDIVAGALLGSGIGYLAYRSGVAILSRPERPFPGRQGQDRPLLRRKPK